MNWQEQKIGRTDIPISIYDEYFSKSKGQRAYALTHEVSHSANNVGDSLHDSVAPNGTSIIDHPEFGILGYRQGGINAALLSGSKINDQIVCGAGFC